MTAVHPVAKTLELRCPNDCGRLTPFAAGAIDIPRCPVCAGIYVSVAVLKHLHLTSHATLETIDASILPADRKVAKEAARSTEPRPCPNCRTLMLPITVHTQVPVILDRCGVCSGIWADDRELAAVSAPMGEDAILRFAKQLPSDVRDEVTLAIYEAEERSADGTVTQFSWEAAFPTFAAWVRTAAPQKA